jgi:hypothetical protein
LLRPDRPIDPENADRLRELLKSEPYLSHKSLSRRLNPRHDTVHRLFTEELGSCKIKFKWIPHSLTESHDQKRVGISTDPLRFLEESSPQKLANVFTGDESWFSLDTPRKLMWLASGVPRLTRVRRNIGARNVMISICFSRSGSYDVVMLSHGERFNRDFFIDEVLKRYDEH